MNFDTYYIPPDTQHQTEVPFELLGVYKCGYVKYELGLNARFSQYHYMDFGGRWIQNGFGTYKLLTDGRLQLLYAPRYRKDAMVFHATKEHGNFKLHREQKDDESPALDLYKLDFPKIVRCIASEPYPNALKTSHKYYAIEEKLDLYKIIGENQKVRWYPKEGFQDIA